MNKEMYNLIMSDPVSSNRLVGCGVILHDTVSNTILVGQRKDTKDWCSGGGKVEPMETVVNASVREMWEETGYTPSALEFLGVHSHAGVKGQNWTDFMFYCKRYAGKLIPSLSEFTAMEWIPSQKVLTMDLFPPFKRALEIAIEKGLIDIINYPEIWTDTINGTGNGAWNTNDIYIETEAAVFEAENLPRQCELYSHGRAPDGGYIAYSDCVVDCNSFGDYQSWD